MCFIAKGFEFHKIYIFRDVIDGLLYAAFLTSTLIGLVYRPAQSLPVNTSALYRDVRLVEQAINIHFDTVDIDYRQKFQTVCQIKKIRH